MAWPEFEDWCYRLAVTEGQGLKLLGRQSDVEAAQFEQIARSGPTPICAKHLRGVMTRIAASFQPPGPVALIYTTKEPGEPVRETTSIKNRDHPSARAALEHLLMQLVGPLHSARIVDSSLWQWNWTDAEIKLWMARARSAPGAEA
jgi:hypothetical protein